MEQLAAVKEPWDVRLDRLGLTKQQKGKALTLLTLLGDVAAERLVATDLAVARAAIEALLLDSTGGGGSGGGVGTGEAAGPGPGSAADAGQTLFNNVTVFVLGRSGYVKRDYLKISKNQFLKKMERERCLRVVQVDERPSQILAVDDCADTAVDVDDVQLLDGMRLAVVVGAEDSSRIAADEYQCGEWAKAHLTNDEGAQRWCFKMIKGLEEGCQLQIEIGGMASSMRRVVLVERKPRIGLQHVEALKVKMHDLERLVAAGAPNTAMLRDPATGLMKPLEAFLLADGWAEDQGEAAACAVRMEECGIAPVLPTGDGGYAVLDSCGRWPVDDSVRRRAQRYLAKPERRLQSGGAATDAGASSGGGGAAGPNSAVGIGRHAISQQAACSPAPTHHLRVHDPFSAAGACVRHRVAPVCRPPHLHPPRQHHSRMQSVRRL